MTEEKQCRECERRETDLGPLEYFAFMNLCSSCQEARRLAEDDELDLAEEEEF